MSIVEKYINQYINLFTIPFCLSLFVSFLGDTSMGGSHLFLLFQQLIYIICFLLFTIRIFQLHYNNSLPFVILFLLMSLIISIQSKDADNVCLFVTVAMIFASKGFSWIKSVRLFFMVGLSAFLLVIVLWLLNILHNSQYIKGVNIRNTLGFGYPLTLSGFVLVLCISFCVFRYYKITWLNIVIIAIISWITYKITYSEMDLYCFIILLLVVILFKIKHNIFSIFPFSFSWISLLVMTFLTFYWSLSFNVLKTFYISLNNTMENRLYMNDYALHNFHIHLLGQYIKENASDVSLGSVQENFNQYFYLDQSMVKILLYCGLIIFSLIIICYTSKLFQMHNTHLNYFVMLFLIIVIRAFTDDSFLKLCYNPFLIILLASFADVYRINKKKKSRIN